MPRSVHVLEGITKHPISKEFTLNLLMTNERHVQRSQNETNVEFRAMHTCEKFAFLFLSVTSLSSGTVVYLEINACCVLKHFACSRISDSWDLFPFAFCALFFSVHAFPTISEPGTGYKTF